MFNSLYIVYHSQKLYGPLESENSTHKENWKIMYTYFYTCLIYYSSVGADNFQFASRMLLQKNYHE